MECIEIINSFHNGKGKRKLNDETVLKKLQENKKIFEMDGFIIDGIFGSYARGEESEKSDVDILYHLNQTFYERYSGFVGFQKLDVIKKTISQILNKKIDLAPKTNLSKTAQKYILKDLVYV